MGIYARARRAALAVACVGGLAAVAGAATPGVALAVCKTPTTGSGSTLQTNQLDKWKEAFLKVKCLGAEGVDIEYNDGVLGGTGSGQGLKEFGMPGGKLDRTQSSNEEDLDGFVGTDDPPTETLLLEAVQASGSFALTMPIVAAPIAIILNIPEKNCTFTGQPVLVTIPSMDIPEIFVGKILGKPLTWKSLLEDLGYTGVAECSQEVLREVRSDSSGTSFAFKTWLCQVEGTTFGEEDKEGGECKEWKAFLTDAPEWPVATKAQTEHLNGNKEFVANKGTGGEIEAVNRTEGSIGYANYGNVMLEPAAGTFLAYAAGVKKFWLELEPLPKELEEPGKGVEGKEGNCPAKLTVAQKGALPVIKGGEDTALWSGFHLSVGGMTADGTYPLCTLTYDIAWEDYLTPQLKLPLAENGYGSEVAAEEVASTVKEFFAWALGIAAGKGQKEIGEGYAALPTEVQERAKKTQELIKE